LKKNPKERLGNKKDVEEILSHPWFESMNLEKIMKKEYVPSFKPKLSSNPLDV
jgi:serine/threonine protein kinase SCH9